MLKQKQNRTWLVGTLTALAIGTVPSLALAAVGCPQPGKGAQDHNINEYRNRGRICETSECRDGGKQLLEAATHIRSATQQGCSFKTNAGKATVKAQDVSTQVANKPIAEGQATVNGMKAKTAAAFSKANEAQNTARSGLSKIQSNVQKVGSSGPLIQRILSTFNSGISASDVGSRQAQIDNAWKDLMAARDIQPSADGTWDVYDNLANHLNAEEIKVNAVQKQIELGGASTIFDGNTGINNATNAGLGNVGGLGNMAGMAGAGASALGQPAGLGALGGPADTGALAGLNGPEGSELSGTTDTTSLAGNNLETNEVNGNKPTGEKLALDTDAIGRGDPDSELNLSTAASSSPESGMGDGGKGDTSLRDQMNARLAAGEEGLSEMEGGAAGGKGATAEAKAAAAADKPGGSASIPGLDTSGGDFLMARSETDAAVNDLLDNFGKDEGNAGGDSAGATRGLASTSELLAAGVEGANGVSLFKRVRLSVKRCLQKGCVTHGVNGKI